MKSSNPIVSANRVFCFPTIVLSNMADEEAGIAPVASISQLPRTDGFTSPPILMSEKTFP